MNFFLALILLLIAILFFVGGVAIIITILKNGFNQMIKGMESIDKRLQELNEKMKQS